MRVHNRFGGMRDLVIFCGDTRECELKTGARRGRGISYFYWFGMRDWGNLFVTVEASLYPARSNANPVVPESNINK